MRNYNISPDRLKLARVNNAKKRAEIIEKFPRISGVYAIYGPSGVYVGESINCWGRATLGLAIGLGLDCGIIRELPNSTKDTRLMIEKEIQDLFRSRGFLIIQGQVREWTI